MLSLYVERVEGYGYHGTPESKDTPVPTSTPDSKLPPVPSIGTKSQDIRVLVGDAL